MSTGCECYGDALVDLVRGELEPGRAERVEAHLETCDACRAELAVVRAVRQSPAPVPDGLDARIRTAVAERLAVGARAAGGSIESTPRPVAGPRARSPWQRWRIWALPAAAAAALTLWVGGALVLPSDGAGPTATTEPTAGYDPYGVWPTADGVVAGDVVLSELTVEELEALLEEMQ
ncbi:MAG: anti-sigma factor family protein [Candidatus Longimicrobiales bacterium M2_2A_002]